MSLPKKQFADQPIIHILQEAEGRDEPAAALCKRHNISERTFYRWRNKFGGMDVADARRLKELELESDQTQATDRRPDVGNRWSEGIQPKKRSPRRAGARR
jgi:putative transposase